MKHCSGVLDPFLHFLSSRWNSAFTSTFLHTSVCRQPGSKFKKNWRAVSTNKS